LVEAALSSMETIQRVAVPVLQVEIPTVAAAPALQVEIPTAVAVASSPDLFVGEEGLQAGLDTTIGADASSLDPKAARILLEAVVATPEVHQLWEILPTTPRVPSYSEKPVTKKIESCMFNNRVSGLNTE
jgi:hypothetical protein